MKNYSFSSVEFLTADEKMKILKNWIIFLKALANGEQMKMTIDKYGNEIPIAFLKFTDRIYKHLSLHCGFIAHYNRFGFFSTYFNGDETNLHTFFENIESWGDYEDITNAMLAEYEEMKNTIFSQANNETDRQFEVLKESVKRAEGDEEMKKLLLHRIYN